MNRARLPLRMSAAAACALTAAMYLAVPAGTSAAERLCDASFEDCRTPLVDLIRAEQAGIDVAFWFMTDRRYAVELIRRWQAGVPVRIIVDPRANPTYAGNKEILDELAAAGIPMRQKSGGGILHWKMMLFAGQSTVQFSGANYSDQAFVPRVPYQNYVDEVIYFSDDSPVVNSFRTRYDDLWTSSAYSNYANVTDPLVRHYATFTIDPELNFPPTQSFRSRSIARYNAETLQIDVVMFRITDRAHTDALVAALGRGVRVRLITDYGQYTLIDRYWHSWNVDRLIKAGAEVRAAGERADRSGGPSLMGHLGTVHQKSTILYSQGISIFGSSNWTSPSSDSQDEHNYFTTRPLFFQSLRDQFERKWNNSNPVGAVETAPLVPMPPDPIANVSPANGATGQSTASVTLQWLSGYWTHVYDVYLGTTANPPLLLAGSELGPSTSSTNYKSFTVTGLQPGTTYYWRIVGKTMADVARSGPIWSFTTAGAPPPPPPTPGLPAGWASQDIGSVGVAGSTSESGGTFTVRGSGADIWGSADAFHFAYTSLSGDGVVIARVATLQNTNPWAKSGVMIRETLAAGSTHAMMLVSPSKGLAFQRRTSTNGLSTSTAGPAAAAPYWVKIERVGHTFHAATSPNGSSWTLVGSDTIGMGATVYVGLAITSHANSVLATSALDSVSVTSSGTPPPPPPGLPSGWSSQDIGATGAIGSASESSGTFTIRGSGADIWGTSDAFHFAYRTLDGDGVITARVATLQHTHAWAKTGVMIRESLAPGSKHASMIVSPSSGLAFQRRTATGGVSTHTGGPAAAAPYWVRLARSGQTITAFVSPDGSTWTLVGSDTIAMTASVYVGLPVTSHAAGIVATATVTDVSVTGGGGVSSSAALPAGWTGEDVGAVAAAGHATYSGGTFTVDGSGDDIWGTADGFHVVHSTLSGDGAITARVQSLAGTDQWTKAGVMIRESTTPDSAYALMLVSRDRGLAFQRRLASGSAATHTDGGAGAAPAWVRLVRTGDNVLAYRSTDGVDWTFVGADTFGMSTSVHVGLAVTSHDNGALARATFDNVDLASGS